MTRFLKLKKPFSFPIQLMEERGVEDQISFTNTECMSANCLQAGGVYYPKMFPFYIVKMYILEGAYTPSAMCFNYPENIV